MKIRENVPISTITTMRLGGDTKFLIDIEDESEISDAFNFAKEKNLPTFILGSGANTIGHDEGFNGVIVRSALKGINAEGDFLRTLRGTPSLPSEPHNDGRERGGSQKDTSALITAFSGEVWDDLVAFACERGLHGIEGLSKIPGLVGAAPVQNIGAYGQDIASVFVSAKVYDIKNDNIVTLDKDDMNFSYRHSILNTTDTGRYFVISITLKLGAGEMQRPFYTSVEKYIAETGASDFSPAGIREIVSIIRGNKLPDPKVEASAGSFFKNIYLTEEEADAAEAKGYLVYHGRDGYKINSGWLIENAGLSGKLLHGIRINEKAALVLINESAKSYADLAAARAEIIKTIQDKYGYTLEQEPVEIENQ